jgi:hypothetical protein
MLPNYFAKICSNSQILADDCQFIYLFQNSGIPDDKVGMVALVNG